MPTQYTDVDRLLLSRWLDVMGVFEAHEDLQDRVEDVVGDVATKLHRWLQDQGYEATWQAKLPSIFIGRVGWFNKKRNEWTLYFELGAFAPFRFLRVKEDYPFSWLWTKNLRMKDVDRVLFSKALRQELGDAGANWSHADTDDADSPLGRYYTDISDADRVNLIADPDRLFDFAKKASADIFEVADPIDRVLTRARAKE